MTSESNRTGAKGVNYVENVALDWGWGFQDLSQVNDDGFDGIIYLREKKYDKHKKSDKRNHYWDFTGGMLHVQIKCGKSYITKDEQNSLHVKISSLDKKKKIWNKSPIPCVLVLLYKEGRREYSYWCDLKSDETYFKSKKSIIKIQKTNVFKSFEQCRGPIRDLVRRSKHYGNIPIIDLAKLDNLKHQLPQELSGGLSTSQKSKAIGFYNKWKSLGAKNPYFGEVIINRTGWSHITRKERPVSRILNSFELLPIAARIINDVSKWRVLTPVKVYDNRSDGFVSVVDFIGITARVILKSRESTEVMVVLKRETKYKKDDDKRQNEIKLWFYTVYEPGRGR